MDSFTRDVFLKMWEDHQALMKEYVEAIYAHNNYVRDQRYFHEEFEANARKLEAVVQMNQVMAKETAEMQETYEEKIAELLEKLSGREEELLELSYKCQMLEGELESLKDRFATTAGSYTPPDAQVQHEVPGDVIETGADWYEGHDEVEHGKLVTFDDVPQIRIPLDDQLLRAASDLRRQIETIKQRIPPNEQLIKSVRDMQQRTLNSP